MKKKTFKLELTTEQADELLAALQWHTHRMYDELTGYEWPEAERRSW